MFRKTHDQVPRFDSFPWRFSLLFLTMVVGWAASTSSLEAQNTSVGATPSTQASKPVPEDQPYWATPRRWTFGFQLTYGLENDIPRNISHVNMLIAAPQVGLIVWDSPHSRLPVKRFEIISEGILGSAFHPGGHLFGDTLLFRFDFKPVRGRVVPFFDAGIGALNTTLNNRAPEITGHTQFLSQGGVGVQYFFRPQRAFVFEYRYFHMSNAGLEEPNRGFNGSMLSVGFRWFFRPH